MKHSISPLHSCTSRTSFVVAVVVVVVFADVADGMCNINKCIATIARSIVRRRPRECLPTYVVHTIRYETNALMHLAGIPFGPGRYLRLNCFVPRKNTIPDIANKHTQHTTQSNRRCSVCTFLCGFAFQQLVLVSRWKIASSCGHNMHLRNMIGTFWAEHSTGKMMETLKLYMMN